MFSFNEKPGSNITLTYDDAGNALTIAATQLTNEQVQDVIGSMLGGDETGGIAVTYDDANNHIDFALSSIPNSSLANSSVTINSNSLALGGTLTLDTGDIGEGSNLYFTNERVDDRVNALVTAGTGITSTYIFKWVRFQARETDHDIHGQRAIPECGYWW